MAEKSAPGVESRCVAGTAENVLNVSSQYLDGWQESEAQPDNDGEEYREGQHGRIDFDRFNVGIVRGEVKEEPAADQCENESQQTGEESEDHAFGEYVAEDL